MSPALAAGCAGGSDYRRTVAYTAALSPFDAFQAVIRTEHLFHRGVVDVASARQLAMDSDPKRQEPEFPPPVPEIEPDRGPREIPPDKDPLEKKAPIKGEK